MPKRSRQYVPKQTLNLGVTPETREKLRAFCEAGGRVQQAVAARLIGWFVDQPPVVQRVVLGEVGGLEEEHAAALEALAAQVRKRKPAGS